MSARVSLGNGTEQMFDYSGMRAWCHDPAFYASVETPRSITARRLSPSAVEWCWPSYEAKRFAGRMSGWKAKGCALTSCSCGHFSQCQVLADRVMVLGDFTPLVQRIPSTKRSSMSLRTSPTGAGLAKELASKSLSKVILTAIRSTLLCLSRCFFLISSNVGQVCGGRGRRRDCDFGQL
jgi:hypothetical protein